MSQGQPEDLNAKSEAEANAASPDPVQAPGAEEIPIVKCRKPEDISPDEVQGHDAYWQEWICPICGGVNLILVDENVTLRYECAYGYHLMPQY